MNNLATLAEQTPAMLWRGDRNGKCVYLNAAMRCFWGLDIPDVETFEWSSSLLVEDAERVFGPFRTGMTSQTPFECEGRYRRHDGAIRVLRTRASPYADAFGQFAGMVGVNEDITDLRQMEEILASQKLELLASLQRFQLAVDITGLALSEHDEDLRYTWTYNLPEVVLGKTLTEFAGKELAEPIEPILREAIDTGTAISREVELPLPGRVSWFKVLAAPIQRPGSGMGVIASALDVTAQTLNAQKLTVMSREMAHRIKNMIAVAQAIVRQSAQEEKDAVLLAQAIEGRLVALGRSQDLLLNGNDSHVRVDDLVQAHLSHVSRLQISGPQSVIEGSRATYLALALNELATNSLKYGSLSVEDGMVQLTWSADGGMLTIEWAEHGGPPINGRSTGFGTSLLNRLFVAGTGGDVDSQFTLGGFRWRAVFPAVE